MKKHFLHVLIVFAAVSVTPPARADLTLATDAKSLALSEGLSIDGVSDWARRPINIDGVVAAMVDGTLGDPATNPKAGDTLPIPAALVKEGGPTTAAWHVVKGEVKGDGLEASGVFGEMPRGAYLLFAVHSDRERVMMLEASGHGVACVNGEWRVGDPYSFGFVRLPILLHEGANQIILQHANRGEMKARLEEPKGEVEINEKDLTLPDAMARGEYHFAVPLINATTNEVQVEVRITEKGSDQVDHVYLLTMPPLAVQKIPFMTLLMNYAGEPQAALVEVFVSDEKAPLHRAASRVIEFAHHKPEGAYKRTYISAIDGSVQYVSVIPPIADADTHAAPGLVLSVHGASVEATSQAASYAAKKGMVIACPTNRRPYGFDWEDWGRIDALEAMDFVAKEFKTDPRRQYLTGHSMGGHGTWQLGCLYPERFAAIAPSAGWLSFSTYMSAVGQKFGPAGDDPVMSKFREVIASSDTVSLLPRLKGKGIYILHGDADDNVPISEARHAREELTKLNIPFDFHEQPGAGHWWDDDAVKKANAGADGTTKWGAACVDWPPIFEMFTKHTLPEAPTADIQPASPLGPDGFHPGSFKRVFNNHFVLVYGTHGTPEENKWAYAKARFDGEQWWYRGNGCARVMSDDDFLLMFNTNAAALGNAVLYGNRTTNSAWDHAFPTLTDPRKPSLNEKWGGCGETTKRLGWLYAEHDAPGGRMYGSVGGETIQGMRALDRMSYFSAGVDYPAMTVIQYDVWLFGERLVAAAGLGGDGVFDHKGVVWR